MGGGMLPFVTMRLSNPRACPVSVVLLLVSTGCGEASSGQTAAGATSNLCADIRGPEAILWDLYNGVPRTDTSVLPPPVPTGGGVYSHPAFPLLGFVYPSGWAPETSNTGAVNEVGVNLIRQDQQAVWREHTQTVNGVPDVRDVRDFELQQVLQFLGRGYQLQIVCINEGSGDAGGGIVVSFSNLMIRAGDDTAVLSTSVTPFPGLPNSNVRAKVVASPTNEFPDRIVDTFLAIDWQMLIGGGGDLFDRDGDGWQDSIDAFPDDPARH